MKQKKIAVAIGLIFAALATGCATTGQVNTPGDSGPSLVSREKNDVVVNESQVADKTEKDKAEQQPVMDGKQNTVPANEEKIERYKIHPGSGVFVKAAPTPIPSSMVGGSDQEITLNFEGADIREVVKVILGDVLKESYIVDPRVQGSITARSSKPMARSTLLPTMEMLLRMNGAAMLRESNGIFKVVPSGAAIKGSSSPRLGGGGRALAEGHSIQVVPLQYVSAREMAKILEPLAPEGGGGVVRVDEMRNLLILSGAEAELRHALETIDMFDVDWMAGMSIGIFPLKHSDVKVVGTELDKLFGERSSSPVAGLLRIVPVERMNALLIVTQQPKYLEQAKIWVERLDQGGTSGGSNLYVYQVQNGKAESIAILLSDIFGWSRPQQQAAPQLAPGLALAEFTTTAAASQAITSLTDKKAVDSSQSKATPFATTPAQPVSSGSSPSTVSQSPSSEVRVIADKDNNALLIYSSAGEYEKIEAAVKKLDVVPRQVLIEMTIAEVTLTDEYQYGLEWYFSNGPRQGGQLDTGIAGIAQLVPGFSYAWKDSAGAIKAVLNTLATNSKLNIISSPHVMVSDNQVAKIQVGDRVPTVSQTQSLATTTTTTGVISSVQYIDTGVMLAVRPHINAGGQVTMEVSQEVSNASKTTTSGIDSPTISKRTAQSTVTIQSGETMVLGGLIKEEKNDGSAGVPLLSEIPILGALFGNQTKKNNRTELVILITPRVANNSQQSREITDEIRKRISGIQTLGQRLDAKYSE
ncbi:MAG: type II secretion system secretin GspD [Gammaproteobacteria bacterium]|nr:type II secretion system secretin GspD [Gammaproteobacteria bacterium]MBU1732908.1 type II secretion system secretin GspD [Gammaproteobacteria bacterium]MBU1891956.1 type II secretion system secretin GspD [Gammaproteobacteria bacterium]